MGTLRRMCATAPQRGPLLILLWADLLLLLILLLRSSLFCFVAGTRRNAMGQSDQKLCNATNRSLANHEIAGFALLQSAAHCYSSQNVIY